MSARHTGYHKDHTNREAQGCRRADRKKEKCLWKAHHYKFQQPVISHPQVARRVRGIATTPIQNDRITHGQLRTVIEKKMYHYNAIFEC